MRVPMPVVKVGIMGVPVHHRRMPMRMAVRLARRGAGRMIMLMMAVMDVTMVVLERFVRMLMAVRLCEV